MTSTSGTMEYSHVQQWQRDILTRFSDIIEVGMGDTALSILDDYQSPDMSTMQQKDPERWAHGMAVACQVKLLSEMEKKGLIESHGVVGMSTGSSSEEDTGMQSGSPS
jgi:hypothetical protein